MHTIFYKFVILSSILCIVFHYRKVVSPSLTLSLSHTHTQKIIFGVFFFLASLFKLISFCVFYNSTLGWYDLVLCFNFFGSLWLLNIILLCYKKKLKKIIYKSTIYIILLHNIFFFFLRIFYYITCVRTQSVTAPKWCWVRALKGPNNIICRAWVWKARP